MKIDIVLRFTVVTDDRDGVIEAIDNALDAGAIQEHLGEIAADEGINLEFVHSQVTQELPDGEG